MKLMLNLKETAEVLGLGINKVQELVRREDFPAMKVGKTWRVSSDGLAEWVREKTKERAEV